MTPTQNYHGVRYDLGPLAAGTYNFSGWVRQTTGAPIQLAIQINCDGNYLGFYPTPASDTWVHETGAITLTTACTAPWLQIKYNAAATATLYVDDVYLVQ